MPTLLTAAEHPHQHGEVPSCRLAIGYEGLLIGYPGTMWSLIGGEVVFDQLDFRIYRLPHLGNPVTGTVEIFECASQVVNAVHIRPPLFTYE
ncbi:hypothetical protein I6U52_21010 [Serratia marcescens]|nr:hypothetical protein [Serratia marcescens]MBH2865779.1 hypothetical protein [Serratia marcescens]MBW4239713.1 hypothetical protein [Enterobacter roggenkampii]